jgi:hypothetical protein
MGQIKAKYRTQFLVGYVPSQIGVSTLLIFSTVLSANSHTLVQIHTAQYTPRPVNGIGTLRKIVLDLLGGL